MSDLRYDPVFDYWTIIAENRRDRPLEFVPHDHVRKSLICPFCAGNEDETPPPLALHDAEGTLIADPASPDWTARVFHNRYPTFSSQAGEPAGSSGCGPYQRAGGFGVQELVIPAPRHVASLPELECHEFVVGLIAAQCRIREMARTPGIVHAMFFCNCRFEAGASIEHVHFQLIGSPLISPQQQSRLERMQAWRSRHGIPLLQHLVEFEENDRRRMIASGEAWSLFCPLASRMPFQAWIVPRSEARSFVDCTWNELEELAQMTQRYLGRLEDLLGQPGYNWVLHQPPFAQSAAGDWFVEIVPRLAKAAGYELGTDIQVNPVSPETAARRMR